MEVDSVNNIKDMGFDDGKNAKAEDGWKSRFKLEYAELEDRAGKLENMLVKYEANTLDFEPKCPAHLLRRQLSCMREYLHILKVRAEIEGIEV